MSTLARQIPRGTIPSVAVGIGSQVAVAVSGICVARLLGVEGRGHFAVLVLVPHILVQLGGLGLPLATTFFIANDRHCAAATVRSLLGVAATQAILLTAIHAAVILWIVRDEAIEVRLAALVTIPVVAPALITVYGSAILQGLGDHRRFNLLRMLLVGLYAVFALGLFVVGTTSLVFVTVAWLMSVVVTALMTMLALRPLLRQRGDGHSDGHRRRGMVGFGLKGLLGSAAPVESFQLDQAIIGLFLSPQALGLYVVAGAFMNLPRFVAQSIGMVAYPHVAALPSDGAPKVAIGRFVGIAVVLCGCLVVVIELSVGLLLPLAFGAEFEAAVPVARVLLVAAFFTSIRRVLIDAARGLGMATLGTVAEVGAWLPVVPVLLIAGPGLTLNDAAWAMSISAVVGTAVMVVGLAHWWRDVRPPGSGACASHRL